MVVLHAGFRDDALLLWVETQSDAPLAKALTGAAAELGLEIPARKRANSEAVVWLPSNGEGPVASIDFDDRNRGRKLHLQPWPVPAVRLGAAQSIHVLAQCANRTIVKPGLMIGADLRYWAAALRFAAGLVMRGQFLPGLEDAQARWIPIIAGGDSARLHALAAAMPPAARAIGDPSGPPQRPASLELSRFVAWAVDALVRDSSPASATGKTAGKTFDSLHDQWLHALQAEDAALQAAPDQLSALFSRIRQWQRPIRSAASAPFRLCFRIEEPESDAGTWLLRYLLQATRDPSLLVPASEAWTMTPKKASPLGSNPALIREHLLASLGQAATIYPPIEASLRERAPEGCSLDGEGAHVFLRDTAAALEQSGFGVMLPSWWARGRAQARLTARAHVKSPKLQGAAGLTLESVVEFNWKLALGDEEISKSELAALARMKSSLVKLRGQWVEVNAAEIKRALEFLSKNPAGSATAGEIIRMSLGAGEQTTLPVEVSGVAATGWIGELLAKLNGTAPFEELEQPEGIHGTLRPYQRRGYSWLRFLGRWALGACLADDMGLGKTIQALALMQHRYSEDAKPILLVCPTSVVGNWQKEAAKFAPALPVLAHHGAARHKTDRFATEAARHAIVLSSYSLLHRDQEALSSVEWGGVLLDEAQNIRNPETKQAKAARALRSGWRVALTGTPVENNVGDLWSLMDFLNPGLLGPQSEFKKRFFVPIQVYGDRGAAERLRRVTGPFILRRLKTDKSIITDLPEKLEMKVFCTLTREQASLYQAVVKDAEEAIKAAEGIARKGLVLATLSKLKQVCNHPAQFLKDHSSIPGRSGKLARLTEMMEETFAAGDRSLIFTQFTEMGELIRQHLQEQFGKEVLFLHGGTSKIQRDRMVERFSADGGPSVFLLSLKAGGTGLNLTRANHVFHFDRWWNPAVENQATDRAFRIGQTKNVQVHKFLCVGTLEEKIDEMIERKKELAGTVVGTGEGWLTELSDTELKNLFALRKDAVGE